MLALNIYLHSRMKVDALEQTQGLPNLANVNRLVQYIDLELNQQFLLSDNIGN